MSETPEVYVSWCCGGVFIPGHGPDNIHELPGLDPKNVGGHITLATGPERSISMRTALSDNHGADVYREGNCPACGRRNPVMEEVQL